MALFTWVLKPEGCFLIWYPKNVWFESHRLKVHYPGKLESLKKLRKKKKKKNIYINKWLDSWVEIPEIFTSQSAYYLGFMKDKIFNLILNSYLNWRHDLTYRLSLRKTNFWWTYDLRSLIFLQKYFINLSLFQNVFSKY